MFEHPDGYKKLIDEAHVARSFAYAPYSGFKVGAALLTETGEIFHGCNIESITYSPTVCAERTAVFKAVSEGKKNFRAIAVVTGDVNLSSPCGVCRQVLNEFVNEKFQVILGNTEGKSKTYTFEEIFPLPFNPQSQIGPIF